MSIRWSAAARGALPAPEDKKGVDPGSIRAPGFDFLMALQGRAFHGAMYAGTASPHKVAKRRAKNKLAKASRKRNRGK
jgi:hypothetical protein